MTRKNVLKIVELLEEIYPQAVCSLNYGKDYELLFSARLAAQCTDERVNQITPLLFERFPTLDAFAAAEFQDLELLIHPCGLYRTKALDIAACALKLVKDLGGKVPDTMEELLTLPGVGRKTANLMLGDVFGKPAIVVDTHCIRLTNRFGLVKTKDPYKIEKQLLPVIPSEKSSDFCHRLVLHGRAVCTARSPDCQNCGLTDVCEKHLG